MSKLLPLSGVTVIELGHSVAAPYACEILGDLGADVIKIEERVGGDPGRGMLRLAGLEMSDRPNFYFGANNRNKRGITLDLKKPEAREVLYKLCEVSDVFVQNFRKGVAARLGLDAATLRARNPRLIYASATGYGPEGPDSGAPSFDYLGLARSGLMLASGEPDDPPIYTSGGIADQMGATMLAFGVLVALLVRERTGRGQEVDASHLGSMSWLQGLGLAARTMLGRAIPRQSRKYATNPLWNHYRCADDQWIALAMLQPDRYWTNLCRVLEIPEAATDARFTGAKERMFHCGDCVALLDEVFARRPRAEWLRRLAEGGDFIATLVNSVDDLPDDLFGNLREYVEAYKTGKNYFTVT